VPGFLLRQALAPGLGPRCAERRRGGHSRTRVGDSRGRPV